MTTRELGKLKQWGFNITKGNVYIELVCRVDYGIIELTIQKNQLKEVPMSAIVGMIYKNGFVDGVKKGERNTQERIKGVLGII